MQSLPAPNAPAVKLLWSDMGFVNPDSESRPGTRGLPLELWEYGGHATRKASEQEEEAEEDAVSLDSEEHEALFREVDALAEGRRQVLNSMADFQSPEMQRMAETAAAVGESVKRAQSANYALPEQTQRMLLRSQQGDGLARKKGASPETAVKLTSRLHHGQTEGKHVANLPNWITQRPEFPGYDSFIAQKRTADALRTKPDSRKEEQIDLICQWFSETMEGVEAFSEQQLRAAAWSVVLREFSANTLIVHESVAGFQFLMVVQGSCRCQLKDSEEEFILHPGMTFGDHVIHDALPPIEGTVRAAQDATEVLLLLKSHYDIQLKSHQTIDMAEAVKCLRKITIFQNWPRSRLERVCSHLGKHEYAPNDTIFKQGEPANYIYFIHYGTVEGLKEFEVLTTNRWPVGHHSWKNKSRKTIQPLHLFTLEGPGNYFGEKSLLFNTARSVTVRAVTACSLYVLGKSEFLKLLLQGKAVEQALQLNIYKSDEDLTHQFTSMKIKDKHGQTVQKLMKQSGSLKNYTPTPGIAWLQQKNIDLYLRNTQTLPFVQHLAGEQEHTKSNEEMKSHRSNVSRSSQSSYNSGPL